MTLRFTATVPTTKPLTTVFTPQPSCTREIFINTIQLPPSARTTVLYLGELASDPASTRCFPDGYHPETILYAPGVCPRGYTEACTGLHTDTDTIFYAASTLDHTTTTTTASTSISYSVSVEPQSWTTCCPTGYACYTSPALAQGTSASWDYVVHQNYQCRLAMASTAPLIYRDRAIPTKGTVTHTRYVTTTLQADIYATGIFVARTSGAIPDSVLASATAPVSSSAGTMLVPSILGQVGDEPPPPMRPGVKAGIAVGCIVGGLLILGAVAFLLLRRRRRRQRPLVFAATADGHSAAPKEGSIELAPPPYRTTEGRGEGEMSGDTRG